MPVIPNSADYVRLIRAGDMRLISRAIARLDEVQIAALVETLTPKEQDTILHQLPLEQRSEVLACMRYEIAAQIVSRLVPEEAASILDNLESDDVADILGEIDKEQLRQILSRLDDAGELEELLAYPENSAGGIMSLDAARVHEDVTIAEATRMLQQEAEELPGSIFYIYVVDEQDRLVGVISLRQLVTSKPDVPIHAVMATELVFVTAETDQETVAELASRYDLVAIPVVDDQRRLLGVVTIDDIVDVLREEATEDILKMAGAGEGLAENRSFGAAFRVRSPWLLAAAVGGLMVAVSLQGFEDALRTVPALALFMPVVAGMGGNVGTQSSTIMVRGIAVGFVETNRLGRVILREVALGASMGMLYGAGIALIAPLLGATDQNPLGLGLVITFGMVGSMVIAATVGASVPLLLHRFNVDPAVATGPFVTTAVDILGLLFYFWLATMLLQVSL
ncbi:MAG: magnesium transporter [Myxococcales bacterium]|nr:magnesium transporter [Myxococcales bacterium]MCB9702647.1 magnesium transporter [Myxococcales bacterium]